jgi:hypothetical protein
MSILALTAAIGAASLVAGLVGALTGLGGGVVLVPLLVLAFHVDIHYAIGASLVSVIATSSGAAAAYLRDGYTNLPVAMLLEIATSLGAISGAALAPHAPGHVLAIAFGIVLLYSAFMAAPREAAESSVNIPPDRLAAALRLDSTYPAASGARAYHVTRVPTGFGLMYIAGALSALLGIGSGAIKVLAMDRVMRLPFKVSTTTSNFMIGVTAAASAGIYLRRGYIDPGLAMPIVLGVLLGSTAGARLLDKAQSDVLRAIFKWVVAALAVEMLFNGITGRL